MITENTPPEGILSELKKSSLHPTIIISFGDEEGLMKGIEISKVLHIPLTISVDIPLQLNDDSPPFGIISSTDDTMVIESPRESKPDLLQQLTIKSRLEGLKIASKILKRGFRAVPTYLDKHVALVTLPSEDTHLSYLRLQLLKVRHPKKVILASKKVPEKISKDYFDYWIKID